MTYIATEPEQITAYVDDLGRLHDNRESAIDANFEHDFRLACISVVESHSRYAAMPVLVMDKFVRQVIEANPEMVRVILGDRDAT